MNGSMRAVGRSRCAFVKAFALGAALACAPGCSGETSHVVVDAGRSPDAAPGDASASDGASPDARADAGMVASCTESAECSDENGCNGVEQCTDGVCVAGEPIACTPANACHTSACEPATGACVDALIDEDGDGHASIAFALCGSDCDDARADVFPGSSEIVGDEVDQNCDGGEVCFVDADRDGFRTNATVVSIGNLECRTTNGEARGAQPMDCNDGNADIHEGATELVGDGVDSDCDGGERCFNDGDRDGYRGSGVVVSADTDCSDSGEAYATAGMDCCDADERVRPGQPLFFSSGAGASACGGWDFDCSGATEARYTTTSSCVVGSGSVPMCMFVRAGWRTSTPSCGSAASWVTNCTGTGSCTYATEARDQECR